jgi:ATP-dependent RNA helicase DeaD
MPADPLLASRFPSLGKELLEALSERGFSDLTLVQEAVLSPALEGRDLRMTSQTGSGKTVAVGFALRHVLGGETASQNGAARPRAIVVAPTRELARQFEQELSWLYAKLGYGVVTTTGGASARDERRALATGPAIVVGTPGRLKDHLSRRSIDPSQVAAVVLDEADRMLDLGFREDLTAILGYLPTPHATHLVSATFPHAVKALADSVQENPAHVEGTRLGAANVDIEHRIVLVDPKERVPALINILLSRPGEQALVFARTRLDVASLTKDLVAARFSAGSLSGEMDQVARNRALAAFKKGTLSVLVATDVAARGIDVQDIAHVIHADPPGDADTYTHRSGRTGRAGRKGTSSVLVTLAGLRGVRYLLGRAGVRYGIESVPDADGIRAAVDARLFEELVREEKEENAEKELPPRVTALAKRLAEAPNVERTLARLLTLVQSRGVAEPVDVRRVDPPEDRPRQYERSRDEAIASLPRPARSVPRLPGDEGARRAPPPRNERPRAPREAEDGASREWATFRVTWGANAGADPRRLLALVCRRGNIRGSDVGAIRVGPSASTVNVAAEVARSFAEAAMAPDPRDPRVKIFADRGPPTPPRGPAAGPGPGSGSERRGAPARSGQDSHYRPRPDPRADVPPARPSRKRLPDVPPARPSRKRLPEAAAPPPRDKNDKARRRYGPR